MQFLASTQTPPKSQTYLCYRGKEYFMEFFIGFWSGNYWYELSGARINYQFVWAELPNEDAEFALRCVNELKGSSC